MADLKESLLSLGVDASLVDQVVSKVGDKKLHVLEDGTFVPKPRLDEVIEQRNAFKKQTEELNNQVTELSKFKGSADEWQKKVSELESVIPTKQKELETQFANRRIDLEINTALTMNKAKNLKAVGALLDKGQIKLDGDNVLGISEQLEVIKKENPYLFDIEQPLTPPKQFGNGNGLPNPNNPNLDLTKL